ncbi:hypothetical protein [Nocardia jiangxiensis]|uniref:hypothetical protein n=1 Tax=Nocardia jiangxiensis TaxID=282685 RepID=UPI0005951084|nr:hypothetical protein [Nocardia jiangxiensis]
MYASDWNPAVVAAAQAMYERLRVARPEWPAWDDLDDIDAIDHYCIAADLAIKAFVKHGLRAIEREIDLT